MEINDRRDGEGLTRSYEIPTRHRGVANRMVLKHLEKSGLPGNPSDLSYPRGSEWDSSKPGGGRPIASWDFETNSGYNHVSVHGSQAQHDAISKRWNVSSHRQDGYGRGR